MNNLVFTRELLIKYFNDEKYFIKLYGIDEVILEKISRLQIREIIVICSSVSIGKTFFQKYFPHEIDLGNALKYSYEAIFEDVSSIYKKETKRKLITEELKEFLGNEVKNK